MYESVQGLVVTDDLPARRLLTTFPIVEEDRTKVVIDFNKGMRRMFTDIWYYGGDLGGAARERTLEVPQSRVFDVKLDGDQLIVRQSAQARDRGYDQNREELLELRYFLTPYKTNDFKSKELSNPESRYVRFWEVQPQLEKTTGRTTSKIARFDIKEPVVFYYSANTPEDYVEAVKDGILYWNKAFGKEVVKAEKAPAGVTAPDSKHNIIQWVPWDNATFAYADVLIDPRTGASQHGQAYITSVFAIGGKGGARELLRLLKGMATGKEAKDGKEKGDKTTPGVLQRFGIESMPPTSMCEVDSQAYAQEVAASIEEVLADPNLTDAAVLRIAQDYVRDVVAHEVGHIVGLVHNFAGSVATTVNHKELEEWFAAYIANPETNLFNTRITSSTVMDYDIFKSRVFIGHFIHTSTNALPYDHAAMQWGYFDSQEPVEKKVLFGYSAGHTDVRTFDYGSEPVVGAYASLSEQIRYFPNSVIETFIRAKAPRDSRDRIPLAQINLSVNFAAARLMSDWNSMLNWFKASTRSVKVENDFDFIGDLDRKEIIQAHWKRLTEQMEKLGGVDRAVFSFMPADLKLELKEAKDVVPAEKIDAKKLTERLGKLLDSAAYTNFVGLDEKTYSFTKEEKELIVKRGKKFFEELEKELVKRICQGMERVQRDIGVEANKTVSDDDIVAQLEKRIIDFSKLVITAKNDDEHRRGKVDKSMVEVVDFKYDMDTRLAAARALADNIGSYKGWSTDAKGDLNKQLKDDVDAALNVQNFKDFQDSSLSRPLREWYLNQQAILALLPPKKK